MSIMERFDNPYRLNRPSIVPGAILWLSLCLSMHAASVDDSFWGAPKEKGRSPTAAFSGLGGAKTSTAPIEVNAKVMGYDRLRQVITASGSAVVQRDDMELRADNMTVSTETHDIEAQGNVVFRRFAPVGVATQDVGAVTAREVMTEWRGDSLYYNYVTRAWRSGVFDSFFDPFHVRAESAITTNGEYVLKSGSVTTCTNAADHCHYSIRCSEIRVREGDRIAGRHAVVKLGPVPVFYLPWWYRSFDPSVGISAEAGYRSAWGYFLDTSTKYWMTPHLRGTTEVDYRSRRGPAVGQEVGWKAEGVEGRLYGYYADDQDPQSDYGGGEDRSGLDSGRYRVRFQHSQELAARDHVRVDADYLSDEFLMEDFFRSEYRDGFQPQNHASYTHRGDGYALGLSAYKRLNDFYTAVDRLPEATLDITRGRIGETPFYYESRNSAAFLQKLWPEDETATKDDYSSARIDTAHTLYYPSKLFGFLNVTPRAGYRATYYSETVLRETNTTVTTVFVTNTVAGAGGSTTTVITPQTRTNSTTRFIGQGSDVRSLPELGVETSFRAFKVLDAEETIFGSGLRHVAEPYANYTFIPEPDLTPDRLYQFDSVDALTKDDSVRFGLRNELQTRSDGRVRSVADVDISTRYNLDAGGEKPFDKLNMKAEFNPAEKVAIFMDGSYDLKVNELATFNARLSANRDPWKFFLEHRYRNSDSSLLTADLAWTANRNWEFGVYDRFEFEESRLEEQACYITRMLDCLGLKLVLGYLPGYTLADGSSRKTDYRIAFQMWVRAFPNVRVGTGGRN